MKSKLRSPQRPARIAVPRRGRVRGSAALAAILGAVSAGCASTAASTPAQPPAQPAAPVASPSPSASPMFTAFAGQWYGHDSYLLIRSNGDFTMGARTFRTCGQDPPPCDTLSGNTITDGNVASGQLTSVSGEVATGTVTRTTDSADSPTGPVTMTLDLADDTISVRNVSFCGPNAPSGTCGA
jgi:hypothetical protein